MVFGIPGIPGIDCFEFVLFMVEYTNYIIAFNVVALMFVKRKLIIPTILFLPLVWGILIGAVILGSYEEAKLKGYNPELPSMREALELYIEDNQGDLNDILESGKYAPTFGKHEINYLLKDLLVHTLWHSDAHNHLNIPVGYNKGNDWFAATLGEPMVYTSGIYKTGKEDLMTAQKYKLDYVAHAIELKKGDKVLDIGCGWGRLVQHFSDEYGADVTGITLSTEQRKFALELNKHNNGKILLQDGMKMSERTDNPAGGFDKITSLEMAEHVGIKRYQEFLTKAHGLLKDDGILYFQVAGLRRQWQFEDLVWGLFMGEHVFPGADASCPMGWVTRHLERAGFEVQRVSNLGNHYSRTLYQWLETWRSKKDSISKKYGETSWRRWEVFLAWSVRVARQGSSTVFMITATKAGQEARRIQTQDHLVPTFTKVN
jgi:cyclopropane fatty-acyl-phospholipid synthase-like methyltransferase